MLGQAAALLLASCSTPSAQPAETQWCKQDWLKLTGRVVDEASILPPGTEDALTEKLAQLEEKTGHQFVIATTNSLQGQSIEDYSLCLARHWAIGRADFDDGVLFLVAPNERKARIDVGTGLEEVLRDEEAAAIMRELIIPAFAKGDFPLGVTAGSDAIVKELQ